MTGRATTLLMMLGPAALALSTIAAKPAKRYIWNASVSVPVGLYRLRPTGSLWVTELVAGHRKRGFVPTFRLCPGCGVMPTHER
jgi:type IV secretory pathway protease TraF